VAVVRISALNLNNVKTALAYRSAILDNIITGNSTFVNISKPYSFDENAKMVRKITQKQKLLTPSEKDEVAIKYESGMNMTEIAELYGCHYTTVGRILRQKGVSIRE